MSANIIFASRPAARALGALSRCATQARELEVALSEARRASDKSQIKTLQNELGEVRRAGRRAARRAKQAQQDLSY